MPTIETKLPAHTVHGDNHEGPNTRAVHTNEASHTEYAESPTTTMGRNVLEPRWVRIKRTMREAFAEFFGTMVLVLFGDGVVAQVVLSKNTKGDYQSISWGWGIGVMMGVYVARYSGGHINPAVTLANCAYRKFPWRKFPVYVAAQILGAMAGAAIVYANYKAAIDEFEGAPGRRTVGLETSTAGIFCTYPAAFLSRTAMFFSEFLATAILLLCIFAMADSPIGHLLPVGLFFLIFGIGACFGWQTGYAINLARDFGPRLVTYGLGYGSEVWSAGKYYFWIPMIAPFLGALAGGFIYDTFLYSGIDSPLNGHNMGVDRLLKPRRVVWSNTSKEKRTEVPLATV